MAREARLLTPHVKGCVGLEQVANGWWDTAWWVTGDVVYANANGAFTRHGDRRWHVLQCNVQDCYAEAIVAEGVIIAAAERALGAPSTNSTPPKEDS